MKPMHFQTSCRQYGLIIEPETIVKILKQGLRDWPKETCGVIVGRYNDNLDHALVTDVIDTSGADKSSIRVIDHADKSTAILEKLWPHHYYLGTWHTHPNGPAVTGGLDDRTMKQIAQGGGENCPQPILMILAHRYTDLDNDLKAFIYPDGEKKRMYLIEGQKGVIDGKNREAQF